MKAMTLHLTALVTKDRFVNLNNRGSREAVAFTLQDSGGKAVGKINFPQCVFAGSFICSTANGGAISVKGVGSQLESFVTFAVFQDGTTGFGNGDLKKNEKVLATITLKVKPSDKANTPSFQKGKRFPAIVAKKQ